MRDKGLSELNIRFLVRFGMGIALNSGMNTYMEDKMNKANRQKELRILRRVRKTQERLAELREEIAQNNEALSQDLDPDNN